MLYALTRASSRAICALFACRERAELFRREAEAARARARSSLRLRKARLIALIVSTLVSAQHDGAVKPPRRLIQRASGKWRGSTLFGYLQSGDEQTYAENFRCSKMTFSRLVGGACRQARPPLRRACERKPPSLVRR